MLPANCYNEWLSEPEANVNSIWDFNTSLGVKIKEKYEHLYVKLFETNLVDRYLGRFLYNQYNRAIKEEGVRESNLTIGSRMYAIMNALCIGLQSRKQINDHMIRWGEDWMELSIIVKEGSSPFILNFKLQ